MKTKRIWNLEAAVYSALRRAHRNSPEYYQTLNSAKAEYFIPSKKGSPMRRVHFKCAQCGDLNGRKEVAVDHRLPVIDPNQGKTNFDDYIKRLFCGTIGLDVLCKKCHNSKTKAENAIRRAVKKEKKDVKR